jgi:hypothetical protein
LKQNNFLVLFAALSFHLDEENLYEVAPVRPKVRSKDRPTIRNNTGRANEVRSHAQACAAHDITERTFRR